MVNHPNRSKANRHAKGNPAAREIQGARLRAGDSIKEAAARIYATAAAWEAWETGVEPRRMHPGLFELYLIKTGQT